MRHVRMFFGLASGIEGEAAQQLRSLVVGRLSVAEAGEVLRSCGLEPQHVLGSGMEGVVFSFGPAKARRSPLATPSKASPPCNGIAG